MPEADLIFYNANVVTVDNIRPEAQLVAVRDGKILFVGSNEDIDDFKGAGTKVIDCSGKTLIPGFNDAHCHIFSYVRKLMSIDLSPPEVESIEDIKAAVRKKVMETPPGEWINGTDYNDFYLAEKRHPTRWELDEAAPDNPVVISHRSLHGCVLNSLALELAGINIATPEPAGAMIGRDIERGGEPDGFLGNMLGYIRKEVMPSISDSALDRGIVLADKAYLSRGITSLQDATVTNDLNRWRHYRRFKENGLLAGRVNMMIGAEAMDEFQEAGLSFGSGDENLRLGAVKIVPAFTSGELYPSPEELDAIVLRSHQAGFQVAIHAIEAGMLDAIICSYENLRRSEPDFDARRHRIEHCAECPPDLMERLQGLGAVIVSHPSFTYFSGDRYLATVDKDMIPWLYRIGTMVKNGLKVAGSSDSPAVPPDPLLGIYGGMTRKSSAGQDLDQNECLPAGELLKLYTINAAYASHEENIKGSITPGKLADMVLLSDDPVKSPPEAVREIKPEMTVVNGKVAWER